MLSMDNINDIKEMALHGYSTRQIASATGHNRETVMKYIKAKVTVSSPIKRQRKTAVDPYIPYIETLLKREQALSNRKHKLTAKRIHSLIATGELTADLPAITLSERTVERILKELRQTVLKGSDRKHLKLVHVAGKAQIDFGEVEMLEAGGETRHFILVLTFPFSNFRMAYVLPAQNFECLAYGLSEMFTRIGRVPTVLRCDNMSTAVAKVIRRDDVSNGQCNHDVIDHPRRLTENFMALKLTYGFDAEFCNPASGNEKGSVENAVGWVRRNFFSPLRRFDGNYAALNEQLALFCVKEAEKAHYRRGIPIKELFKEDLAAMLSLPQEPFDAHSWSEATVTKDCRANFEGNEYQLDLVPGTKVLIKRYWNRLIFHTQRGVVVSEFKRSYGNRKDNIDWTVELKMLCERPSAFNSSYLSSILPEEARDYLALLRAPKRAIILRALLQRLQNKASITEEIQWLTKAIRHYRDLPAESVVAAYRGINDTAADCVKPLTSLPEELSNVTLPEQDIHAVLTALPGVANA